VNDRVKLVAYHVFDRARPGILSFARRGRKR
jgi:hypothetical protein